MPRNALRLPLFLLTPLREGRPANIKHKQKDFLFLLTPLREGRRVARRNWRAWAEFLLTPLREGRLLAAEDGHDGQHISTHAPAGGATKLHSLRKLFKTYFYSRPCGRGDFAAMTA